MLQRVAFLIAALSLNTIKVVCNGLRLESPVNRKNGGAILCLTRNYAQQILRLQKVSSTFGVSKSVAADDQTGSQILSELTLSTLALKVAWLTRHILLLSDIISLDENDGNFSRTYPPFLKFQNCWKNQVRSYIVRINRLKTSACCMCYKRGRR